MKSLLTVTAAFEGLTGIALIATPAFFVSLLLGVEIDQSTTPLVCRLTGSALISLAIICFGSRNIDPVGAGIVKALLFYNVMAASLLAYSWTEGFSTLALWLAVVVHVVLSGWCVKLLFFRKVVE